VGLINCGRDELLIESHTDPYLLLIPLSPPPTMATSAANSAAHQINLASLPPMPRIRPPRLLKGDPHPNNATQLPGQPPTGRLWVQGKWRTPVSNAGKHKREVQVRQITKALRHRTHGLDIYAYRHVRTNQIVYSLSRSLQVRILICIPKPRSFQETNRFCYRIPKS
jgi:hypothetical protein